MSRAPLAAAVLLAAGTLLGACRRAPESKLAELEEILRSRNDNDPRLDRDFQGLSPEAKARFREKYASIPRERRNERGTVVYLLGRNLDRPEDWEFMRAVAAEEPCLSLADCAKPSNGGPGEGDDVTLAYPSLVALHQAARALEAGAPAAEARPVLDAAKASRMKAVISLARTLEPRFDKTSR